MGNNEGIFSTCSRSFCCVVPAKKIPEAKSLIEREDIFHDGIKVKSIWVVERDGKKGFNPNQFNRDHGRLNVATKNERILRIFDIFDITKSKSERLIGTTIPEARSLIKKEDIFHEGIKVTSLRVTTRNGKGVGATMD